MKHVVKNFQPILRFQFWLYNCKQKGEIHGKFLKAFITTSSNSLLILGKTDLHGKFYKTLFMISYMKIS